MSTTLTIHHLRKSQSERILWLCEELGISYNLQCHDRVPPAMLAPESLRQLHWSGTAPVIQDGEITLAESGAIFEYILTKYGSGKLVLQPTNPNYADYLLWLHQANGTYMPAVTSLLMARMIGDSDESPTQKIMQQRANANLHAMEQQLGKYPYLAGNEFTAADCMSVFGLTTFRLFIPSSLTEYPNIVSWLQRVGKREAYQRAMQKGEPGFEPMLSAVPQLPSQ
ncbi:glutathione S-transferase [Penicillium brevicompactum]|uniref:glutathione S-transferase n=1 Tax=Penicillium brevicompactum TaxID=5074 RepID=UPI0025419B50|nr:glutathione S-transferase [Penicillium brevicompactum]KAJ5326262.1 glutathione S-transferase [Penicillium brevicompactum]